MTAAWSGWLAATTFFVFTVSGLLSQLTLLLKRQAAFRRGQLKNEEVFQGLEPARELSSFMAFSLFALSGLTRSYVDYILICTRAPAVVLSCIILGILAHHAARKARAYFGLALSVVGAILVLSISRLSIDIEPPSYLTQSIDYALAISSLSLFIFKLRQAQRMRASGLSAAVSVWRELGILFKDLTGLAYAVSIGSQLFWVATTHVLSGIASVLILLVRLAHLRLSRLDS